MMLNTAGSVCRSIFYYRAITCVCSAFPLNNCLTVRSRRVCGFIWNKKKSHVLHLYVIYLLQTEFIFSFWVQCPICLICFYYYLITLSQSQKTIRSLIAFHSVQRTASVPVKVQLVSAEWDEWGDIAPNFPATYGYLPNNIAWEFSFSLGALGAMMPWKCEFKMKSISEK